MDNINEIENIKLDIISYNLVLEKAIKEGNIDNILECEEKIAQLNNCLKELEKDSQE